MELAAKILNRDSTFSGTAADKNTLRRVDFNVLRDIAQALIDEGVVVLANRGSVAERTSAVNT